MFFCLINISFSQTNTQRQFSEVFSYEMIDSQISYFEQFAGSAKENYGDYRKYKVEGCIIDVSLHTKTSTIRSLHTKLSETCSPDLSQLPPSFNLPKQLNNTTFGALSNPTYYADCLISCGRTEPEIYAVSGGSKADDWQTIALGANIEDLQYQTWFDELQKNGEQWMLDQKFNCAHDTNNYSNIAHNELSPQKVSSIIISKSPIDFQCSDESEDTSKYQEEKVQPLGDNPFKITTKRQGKQNAIYITSLEDSIIVNNVIVNRNQCIPEQSTFNFPMSLQFGNQIAAVYMQCNILEISIHTNRGNVTYSTN